ncbi:MAG TPA: threonine synthase, partial [Phycisphaerae bacterium]|nr:threonine synthase [Phycisphaerae bacterium]
MKRDTVYQQCINARCEATFPVEQALTACPECGDLLDARYDWDRMEVPKSLKFFETRWATRSNPLDFSGVWRFRELLNFCADEFKTTIGEGQTILEPNRPVAEYVGADPSAVFLQYEGLNPSGSF